MRKSSVMKVKSKTLGKWAGMNSHASKSVGYRFPSGKAVRPNTIVVDRSLPRKETKIIVHESVEEHYMRKGMSYENAHEIANKVEGRIG